MLETRNVTCPYCWAGFEATVDRSAGEQDYYEDCPVCCNPVRFVVHLDGDGELSDLDALREDD